MNSHAVTRLSNYSKDNKIILSLKAHSGFLSGVNPYKIMLRALFLPVSIRVRGGEIKALFPIFGSSACLLFKHTSNSLILFCEHWKEKSTLLLLPVFMRKTILFSTKCFRPLYHFRGLYKKQYICREWLPSQHHWFHTQQKGDRQTWSNFSHKIRGMISKNHWSAKTCLQKGKTKHVCFEKLEDY